MDQKWLCCLIHNRHNLLQLLNVKSSCPRTRPLPPLCLHHRLMTFNHDGCCVLLVTGETQCKSADAIPDIILLAYNRFQKTGSPLVWCLLQFNRKQITTCKRFIYATHVSSNDHFSSSFFYTC